VDRVLLDREPLEHPLLGASVRLLDDANFEGRNWIIAQDGFEPIVPFHLAIESPRTSLDRAHAEKVVPPFSPELRAQGLVFAPGEIREASGIWDLAAVWRTRASRLESDIPTLEGSERVRAEIRLQAMRSQLDAPPSKSALRYFPAKMSYFVRLASAANARWKTTALYLRVVSAGEPAGSSDDPVSRGRRRNRGRAPTRSRHLLV
jgi:hypothetical protein